MIREHFVQKILDVKLKVLRMGTLVENIIDTAVTALNTRNLDLARIVCEKDDEIDLLGKPKGRFC